MDQKTYLLHVSPDTQRLWISHPDMSEEQVAASEEKGHRLPDGVYIDHVAYPQNERFSSGTIPIAFYPEGYSDKAIIRIRNNDGDRLSFFIEPFLPGADLVKGSQGWSS